MAGVRWPAGLQATLTSHMTYCGSWVLYFQSISLSHGRTYRLSWGRTRSQGTTPLRKDRSQDPKEPREVTGSSED